MAAEPAEDEIENFISFTSSSREQAIHFLRVSGLFSMLSVAKGINFSLTQANDMNSNKAINAYYENPNSFGSEVS